LKIKILTGKKKRLYKRDRKPNPEEGNGAFLIVCRIVALSQAE
jgi:hypothetical protein